MKNVIAVLFLAALSCAASTIATTVGFEDDISSHSDRDFNDIVVTTTGIDYTIAGTWTRPPVGSETPYPFPMAYYFSGATVAPGGDAEVTFDFAQSADPDKLYVKVGAGAYQLLSGHLTVFASVGDEVDFKMFNGTTWVYPSYTQDSDHLYHAVEYSPSPEPNTEMLFGGGLIGMVLLMRRHRKGGKA